ALLVQLFLHAQPVLVREIGSGEDGDALGSAGLRHHDLVLRAALANFAAHVRPASTEEIKHICPCPHTPNSASWLDHNVRVARGGGCVLLGALPRASCSTSSWKSNDRHDIVSPRG